MYDVIIPARDEERTVAQVVLAAMQARGVSNVIVVDDHSADGTAQAARDAGARVIGSGGRHDKALALATGVAASTARTIVFFDADIIGVRPEHIEALAEPVLQGYSMCAGLVDYGPRNAVYLRLPPISGMRAIRREIFDSIPERKLDRYNIEALLNSTVVRNNMRSAIRVLSGTTHRSKVAKRGWRTGLLQHARMVRQLISCYGLSVIRNYVGYIRRRDVLVPTRKGTSAVVADLPDW